MNLRRLMWLCATVLFVALIVIGCSKKVPPPPPPPPVPPPAPTAPPSPPPPPPPPAAPAPAPPPAPKPLSEEEIFRQKTLAQLNAEMPLADVIFDYDQFNIRDDQRGVLQKNADYMRRWTTVRATVEGHADARGTNEYNLALGQRRANCGSRLSGQPGRDRRSLRDRRQRRRRAGVHRGYGCVPRAQPARPLRDYREVQPVRSRLAPRRCLAARGSLAPMMGRPTTM